VYLTPKRGTIVYNFNEGNLSKSSVDQQSRNDDTVSRDANRSNKMYKLPVPGRDNVRVSQLNLGTNKELPPRPSYNRNKETIKEEDIQISNMETTKSQNFFSNPNINQKKSLQNCSTAMNSNVYTSNTETKVDVSQSKGSLQDFKKQQKSTVKNVSNAMLTKEINRMLNSSPVNDEPNHKKVEIKSPIETKEVKVYPRRELINNNKIIASESKTPENKKKEQVLHKPALNNFSKTKGLVNFTKLRYL